MFYTNQINPVGNIEATYPQAVSPHSYAARFTQQGKTTQNIGNQSNKPNSSPVGLKRKREPVYIDRPEIESQLEGRQSILYDLSLKKYNIAMQGEIRTAKSA